MLGGDNAVVIALACRHLPPAQRKRGILLGTAGAIALRIVLVAFAVSLLALPWLHVIGGALLIWIGIRLMLPEPPSGEPGMAPPTTLASAVRTVIVADLVMSLDNVIGIAAAAAQAHSDHRLGLVIFGLLISVPIIVWGSRLVLMVIERFAWVVWIGGALLGWIAGGLIIADPALAMWMNGTGSLRWQAPLAGAVFVLVVAWALSLRRPAEMLRRS